MSHATYRIGDVFERLAEIPDGSVDLVLTSPPFLALRSYLPADHPDKGKEIGSEPTPAAFLDTLLALTAEWRRVLAPHGSICVELGDTYSGNFPATGTNWGNDPRALGKTTPPTTDRSGPGWPLAKSLVGVPHLYHLSLAYGRNLLTGEPSPAGQWRIRNVVAWCRPNPPVGALGDKFRPATSYMTVACVSDKRWFDLDAVRTPVMHPKATHTNGDRPDARQPGNTDRYRGGAELFNNPAGAPPLDWWEIPTQPYSGSHYATWPEALCVRPILAMCPQRVCRTCGEPSRRIVGEAEYHQSPNAHGSGRAPEDVAARKWESGIAKGKNQSADLRDGGVVRVAPTLGWTDCGHGSLTCGACGIRTTAQPPGGRCSCGAIGRVEYRADHWRPGLVLDPFAGSGTTLKVATGHGRNAIGIDLDARNADLAAERVGMFLTIEEGEVA